MRNIITFAMTALVAAVLVPRFIDRMPPAASTPTPTTASLAAPTAPSSSPTAGPRSVTIAPDWHGHFQVDAIVEGRQVPFMIDTGASQVVLTTRDAARLGFHPAPRDYTVQVRTANGVTLAAPLRLETVEVGAVMLHDVSALVGAEDVLSDNLLGLSFLSRLHRFEYRDGRMILEE